MKRHCRRGGFPARGQSGFAMIAILSLIALMSAYLIANALGRTSAELSNARERRSMDALRQAKAVLIAYAASEQWQKYKGQTPNQPGGLPCPDSNDTGASPGICPAAADRVGRLPWATIGSDDLRDASGERLWYAVSSNFYKNAANIINSDTPGLLTVNGTAPASNIVAIVFAPGEALSGQDRIAQHNNRAAYLEGVTVGATDSTFNTVALPSDTANDRLLVITQADLMSVVEPVVVARIERDVKPLLQDYFSKWGAYPFVLPFGGGPPTAQSAYQGASGQTSGLLPITAAATYPWTAGSGAVALTGGTAGSISGISCNTVAPGWQCSFTINSVDLGPSSSNWGPCTDSTSVTWRYCIVNPSFNVQGKIGANAGKSFANLPNASAVTVTNSSGSTTRSMLTAAINGTLISNGVGTVIFQGTHDTSLPFICCRSSSFSRSMMVTIPDVVVSALTSSSTFAVSAATNASPISITTSTAHNFSTGKSITISGVSGNTAANGNWTVTVTDSTHLTLNGSTGNGNYVSGGTINPAAWFIANEWYRQTFYAVSPGFAPGGSGSCTSMPGWPGCFSTNSCTPSAPSCLAVYNKPAPSNNKEAILVLAGRALDGNPRPSAYPENYLEKANLTALGSALYVYEHRAGVPTAINDRVVVVSP